MDLNDKFQLITRGFQEIVDEDRIPEIIKERPLRVYLGTAPTGNPSFGYLIPFLKVGELLDAGCEVTILFADIHAYLDNLKSSWELLGVRTEYYEFLIKEILNSLGYSPDRLKFVRGSSYQLEPSYTKDLYRLAALSSISQSKKAGAEVIKQSDNPPISGILYPLMQALDEEYLKADCQMGGIDQRKIFMYAREFLPKIGYSKRIHMMTPMLMGLGNSEKMSSSDKNSKIDFFDDTKKISKKIRKTFCEDGRIEKNVILQIFKEIIFKIFSKSNKKLIIKRDEKYGGDVSYANYLELEKDFKCKKISSIDLKNSLIEEIDSVISPIREKVMENVQLLKKAYPDILI